MREGRRRPSLGGRRTGRDRPKIRRNEGGAPAPLVEGYERRKDLTYLSRNEGGAPAPLVGLRFPEETITSIRPQ